MTPAPWRGRHRLPRSSGQAAAWLAGILVAAVGVAGCGSSAAGPSTRVGQWMSTSGFGSAVGTLLGDGTHVVAVVRHHAGASTLKAWCGVLENDAATAAGNLPSPDAALTSVLDHAYQADQKAAAACYGASPSDVTELDRSVAEINVADAYLEQAVQHVSALTGQVPSTTTTTVPGGAGGDPLGF